MHLSKSSSSFNPRSCSITQRYHAYYNTNQVSICFLIPGFTCITELTELWSTVVYFIYLCLNSPLQCYQLSLSLQKGSSNNFSWMRKDIKFKFFTWQYDFSTQIVSFHEYYPDNERPALLLVQYCSLKPPFGCLCKKCMHPGHKMKHTVELSTSWKSLESLLLLCFLPLTRLTGVGFFETRFHTEDSLEYLLLHDTCCLNWGQHIWDYHPV